MKLGPPLNLTTPPPPLSIISAKWMVTHFYVYMAAV